MRISRIFILLISCSIISNAFCGTQDVWIAATGNFSVASNWQNGGPSSWTSGGEIEFNTSDTYVTVSDGAWNFSSDMVFEVWNNATIEITNGADLGIRKLYLGIGGTGSIVQTGGSFGVYADDCHFGSGTGGQGSYTISGGVFYAKKISLSSAEGNFTVVGDAADISTQRLYIGSDRSSNYGAGTLEFKIAQTGVSAIVVTAEFHLDEGGSSSAANLVVTAESSILSADDIILVDLTDSGAIDGSSFDTLNFGSASEGTSISLGGNQYLLTYCYDADGDGAGNDVALVYQGGSIPSGAHTPDPQDEDIVVSSLDILDWISPDPGTPSGSVYCTVYLGTQQDRSQMDSVALGADISDVSIDTVNFPRYGSLVNQIRYYWAVDVYDPSVQSEPIEGPMWSFYVYDDVAPAADAGQDRIVWLGQSGISGQRTVALDGTTSDDGPYSVLWTQVDNGSPSVAVSPNGVDDTSVTFTRRGTYEFMLTADDGVRQTSDTVEIIVGDDSCDASHISTLAEYDTEDVNEDCIVDLSDFAILFAEQWLDCTDTLTDCGE